MLDFKRKPIIAMLHLKGDSDAEVMERMIKETEIYYRNGIDAVLVENYFGSTYDCIRALDYLSKKMPGKQYGVNILGDYNETFELASKYKADFIQIDSVSGHLSPEDDADYANELITLMNGRTFQVLGGLRFKYQPIKSGRTFREDAELAMMRCDAVVTTGAATGRDCPIEKLEMFRGVINDFPLIIGAGVTADNVCQKLPYVDGVIAGSWFKENHYDYGDVCEEYVKRFMDKVIEYRANYVK